MKILIKKILINLLLNLKITEHLSIAYIRCVHAMICSM